MGTRNGSGTKAALTYQSKRQKSCSISKKPASTARDTKSRHFLPRASIDREIKIPTGWEEWEDQLVLALHKEGNTDMEISQHLPDRSEGACRIRIYMLKARSQNVSTRSEDVYAPAIPRKKPRNRPWEDWEDRIVVAIRNAGYSWANVAKMLPHRTDQSVISRWNRFLMHQAQHATAAHAQSLDTSSIPRPERTYPFWTQEEDQLVKSLRESGKSWAYTVSQLQNRSQRGTRNRWKNHLKYQRTSPKEIQRLPWEEWEERLLVSGYFAGLSWKEISEAISRRTANGSMCYWYKYLWSSDQGEPWTVEDLALLESLRRQGSDWSAISLRFPGHTPNACRMQWYKETEGIQSTFSRRKTCLTWSAEEVETLIALYNTIGPRWQEISKHLPGRSEFACERMVRKRCTKEDRRGGTPSEFWKEFFESVLHPDIPIRHGVSS